LAKRREGMIIEGGKERKLKLRGKRELVKKRKGPNHMKGYDVKK